MCEQKISGSNQQYQIRIILLLIRSTWKLPHNQVHGSVNVTENYRHKKAIEFSSLNVLLLYNRVHVESAGRPRWADVLYIITLIYFQVRLEYASCLGHSGLRCGSWGGVDILRGYLRCDFDDAGFVDDACRAVAFLYDADDPRLVTLAVLGRFDLGTKTGCLLTWKTDQQTSYRKIKKEKKARFRLLLFARLKK